MISVVIPVHDQATLLPRALRSVRDQTLSPGEVLVVDDGSAEPVPDLGAWGARVLSQPHAGPGAARNAGLRAAHGAWVAFLDADDEWTPRFLERAAALAGRSPEAGAVFSNYRDSGADRPALLRPPAEGLVPDYFRVPLGNAMFGMCASATVVRRAVALEAGGFAEEVPFGEDLDLWARLAWTAPIGFVDEVLATYHRDTPDSLSKKSRAHPRPPRAAATWRRWEAEGRIPVPLRASSRAWAERLVLDYAVALACSGRAGEGRAVLLDLGLRAPLRERWLAAWAHCLVPQLNRHA